MRKCMHRAAPGTTLGARHRERVCHNLANANPVGRKPLSRTVS